MPPAAFTRMSWVFLAASLPAGPRIMTAWPNEVPLAPVTLAKISQRSRILQVLAMAMT
jgi:hypothetical protein